MKYTPSTCFSYMLTVIVSVDFYVRIFVRVFHVCHSVPNFPHLINYTQSPVEVKRSCTRRCYIHQSTQCPSFYVQVLFFYSIISFICQPMGVISSKKSEDPNATFTNCSLSTPSVCEETGGRLKVYSPPTLDLSLSRLVVLFGLVLSTAWSPHPQPPSPLYCTPGCCQRIIETIRVE